MFFPLDLYNARHFKTHQRKYLTMNKKLKKALDESPLKFYDTVLFLSAEEKEPHKQDFAMMGDSDTMIKHFAAMLMRHKEFQALVFNAVTLYNEVSK